MNMITRDNFTITRQPSGDVWITGRTRQCTSGYGKLAPKESEPLIIPKEDCQELARFLLLAMNDPDFKSTIRSVDYSRCVGEPE